MNILIVTPFKLNTTGGVTTAVKMWRQQFERMGHNVVTFQPESTNRICQCEDDGSPHVYGAYLRWPYIEGYPIRSILSFFIFLPYTLLQLARFIASHQIDVVSIQYPVPWMFYFGILRRFSRWKLITTYQGNDAHDLHMWTPLEKRMTRYLLTASDHIVFVSSGLLKKVDRALPGLSSEKVVIPNGASLELARTASQSLAGADISGDYIISIGHLIHRKGMDTLLDAMRIIRDQGREIELVVVGDGPERELLLKKAHEYGIANTVHLIGDRSHEETLAWLKRSKFFVLASRAEGLPLVVAEAMLCGKAVVASNVDGIPDIVEDGKTGLLCPSDDPEALAHALLGLYDDEASLESFAKRGEQRALQNYTWESVAERHIRLYEGLVDHPAKPRSQLSTTSLSRT